MLRSIARLQRRAARRIDQLLDALKTDRGPARPPVPDAEGDAEGGGGRAGRPSDGIPQLAQLKVLRSLQEEVNERTADLGKRYPDPGKIPQAVQRELQALRKDQQEIADLLDELTTAGEPKP